LEQHGVREKRGVLELLKTVPFPRRPLEVRHPERQLEDAVQESLAQLFVQLLQQYLYSVHCVLHFVLTQMCL
jgi:hypothetical protein